jgi:hypothetical protein
LSNGVNSVNVNVDPREMIKGIESDIFKVTDQIENLDEDSDINLKREVKLLLEDLKKRSSTLRINLEKENKPQNKVFYDYYI